MPSTGDERARTAGSGVARTLPAGDLWQAQKLEVAGRLANIVAHDLNNLLVVIQGYSDILLAKATDEGLRDKLGRIRSAAVAAGALSKQMLTLSRRNTGTVAAVDLNLVVRTVKAMFARVLPANVAQSFVLAEDLGYVLADPGEVDQILMNLVSNAIDAMPSGGSLTIATANLTVPDASPMGSGIAAGDYVTLCVSDTGEGMNAATLARLFEPGFTTKAPDDGSGLGLHVVRAIVRRLSGDVVVESAPGKGTAVTVWVPCAQAAAEPSAAARARAVTVLIADPDETVRGVLAAGLDSRGHTVLAAASGDQALRVAAGYGGVIDILLASEVLADIAGIDLADRITLLKPGIRALVAFAGPPAPGKVKEAEARGCRCLAKPFGLQELTNTIFQALSTVPGHDQVSPSALRTYPS